MFPSPYHDEWTRWTLYEVTVSFYSNWCRLFILNKIAVNKRMSLSNCTDLFTSADKTQMVFINRIVHNYFMKLYLQRKMSTKHIHGWHNRLFESTIKRFHECFVGSVQGRSQENIGRFVQVVLNRKYSLGDILNKLD